MRDDVAGVAETIVDDVRSVADRHPVEFVMCFGSAVRDADDVSDVDLAVEFDSYRPADDGYSDVYLRLQTDLERTLSRPVDVVDVHAMPPTFAAVAFEDGVVLVGSEDRRAKLESELAGDPPSVADARERVDAAVARLREQTRG